MNIKDSIFTRDKAKKTPSIKWLSLPYTIWMIDYYYSTNSYRLLWFEFKIYQLNYTENILLIKDPVNLKAMLLP